MEVNIEKEFQAYLGSLSFTQKLELKNFDKKVFFAQSPVEPKVFIFTCYDENFTDYLLTYPHVKYFHFAQRIESLTTYFVGLKPELYLEGLDRDAWKDLVSFIKEQYIFQVLPAPSFTTSPQLPDFL